MSRQRKQETPIDIQVPITPMLDMSFQLLSFFILTFHPMPTEGQLAINLPKLEATESPPPETPLPPEEIKDQYTITVHAGSGGDVALLGLSGPAVNVENIKSFNELQARLSNLPKPPGRGADGISITIESSEDLNYGRLIEIMDLCKKAGYDSVNLMPMRKDRG